MASSSYYLLSLLCFLSVISFSSSSSSTITLSLSPLFTKHTSSDPLETFKFVASASLTRAHHLKHYKSNLTSSRVKTPVHPQSYGGYSIDLKFGTPPQSFPFVLDTGSSLVWFPCTSGYLCSRCNFPNIDSKAIPKFIPRNSSSTKIVGCKSSKCAWIFGSDDQTRCQTQTCPPYIVQYGLGSTAGFLISDNLDFPEKIVTDFLVGCSILSMRQPAGIAGFGRGRQSLPSQMRLKRFSYCLLSHRFDDSPESSDLVLYSGSSSHAKTEGLSYAPFYKNPITNNTALRDYYYVSLKKIKIGGKSLRIPYNLLVTDSDGNGGSIVDSGSTFTFMETPIFDLVAQEFEKQMANYTRAKDIEAQSGLRPCFDISKEKTVNFPEFIFQFKGGAKMTLPLVNYFSLVGGSGVVCLTVVSDSGVNSVVAGGPAIVLGNYQQQNFYVEYDLENNRFGFKPQNCQKGA